MEFIVGIASLVIVALVSLIFKNKRVIETAALAGSAVALGASGLLAYTVATLGTYSPVAGTSVDSLGALIMLVVATIGFFATIYAIPHFSKEVEKGYVTANHIRLYYGLSALFLAMILLTISVTHPITAWILLEATTLATVFLVSFYRKGSTVEAAWKYIIINAVGLLFAFFGTLLYFTAFRGEANPAITWDTLLAAASNMPDGIMQMAFIIVLIGYGTKIGLAPMHTWKPDAYSKAPAPLGALFSAALMPAAFVILFRFKEITDAAIGSEFSQNLLVGFGVLTVLIAAPSILTTRNYKRMLAYSSVEHAGLVALALGFGGWGVLAAILHLIYHSLIKASLFFLAGNMLLKYSSAHIVKVTGMLSAIPVTAALFFVGLFAVTGLPPFGIFTTETLMLASGLQQYAVWVVLVMVALIVTFIGFFRHTSAMAFSEASADIKPGEGSIWLIVPPIALLSIALTLAFFAPPFIQTLINQAVAGL